MRFRRQLNYLLTFFLRLPFEFPIKDKKSTRDEERLIKKEEISSSAGPSLREVELNRINDLLSKQDLIVKIVAADGHCLYRYVHAVQSYTL